MTQHLYHHHVLYILKYKRVKDPFEGDLWGNFHPQKMAQIIIFGAYLSVTSSFLLFSVYLFLKALLPMFNFLYL